MHGVRGHGSLTSIASCLDHEVQAYEVPAMDRMTTFTAAAAAVAASLAMVVSTGALGACETTLRGELVQAPDRLPAVPRKFLVFTLSEVMPYNAMSAEKRLETFQIVVVPNTSTTLPIPFALDVDSPKGCPRELELEVGTYETEQPFIFTNGGGLALTGGKAIRLDRFESIPVWRQAERF